MLEFIEASAQSTSRGQVSSKGHAAAYKVDWKSYSGWDFPGTSFLNGFRAYGESSTAALGCFSRV